MAGDRAALQDQLDALSARVDALTRRMKDAGLRADVSDRRQDAAEARQDASDERQDASDARQDAAEAQAELDREILATLQIDEGLVREHVGQLERALRTSRTIGAAIGLVMARNNVDHDRALEILKAASSRNNVKLQTLSDDMVKGGTYAL